MRAENLHRLVLIAIFMRPSAHLGCGSSGGEWDDTRRSPRHLNRETTEIFVLATVGGVPAGYFELDASERRETELSYFGLIPEFIGRGLGQFLLQAAIDRAWSRPLDRLRSIPAPSITRGHCRTISAPDLSSMTGGRRRFRTRGSAACCHAPSRIRDCRNSTRTEPYGITTGSRAAPGHNRTDRA